MLQFKSIEEWLASLKLSRYVDNFQQAGVTTLDAVTRLSHADLSGLGIILLGHQRKIMNSIQAMRAQLSISMSEGFLVWLNQRIRRTELLFNNQCVREWWWLILPKLTTDVCDYQDRLHHVYTTSTRNKKKEEEEEEEDKRSNLLHCSDAVCFRFFSLCPCCIAASNLIDSHVALTMMYIV